MKELFLDMNAHVPMSHKTLKLLINFSKNKSFFGHPSSPSILGREAAKILEDSRAKIAKLIGAKDPSQIIFTNSCTQACEWAYYLLKNSGTLFVSPIEHPASFFGCQAKNGLIYSKFKVSSDGLVNFETDQNIGSASCIYVQNEIGTIQPINTFKHFYPNALLFSDMSQALGKMPVNVTDLQVDVAAFGAHKFGGPSGIGFLYLKDLNNWTEFGSGSRYFMDIAGTPNIEGAFLTAAALQEANDTLTERMDNMKEFQSMLENGLESLNFEIIGKNSPRITNTTFVKTPQNALNLMLELGNKNIHCGLGSACGSLYTGGSPLMRALGRESQGQEYLRFSQWGYYNKKDAEYLLDCLNKMVKIGKKKKQ